MQVEVDVKCVENNFGWRGTSSFGDFAPFLFAFEKAKFPFGPWTIKKRTKPLQELLNKIRTEKE